jgi:hypothetical protein
MRRSWPKKRKNQRWISRDRGNLPIHTLIVRRGPKTGAPNPTREQYEYNFKLDPEIKPQTRRIRLMNMGYGLAFLAWYCGAVYFIMYRLRSDDLETLEKEAEERIKIKKMVRDNMRESSGKKL